MGCCLSSPQEVSTASPQEVSTASPQEVSPQEISTASPQEIVKYPKLYDAFISHRGPDVKHTLAKQLYEHLNARGCRAFLEGEEIERGDSISFAIRNGIICSSLVQIAIFSKEYAESSWCLDELVLMLEQSDALFIPVFYDVGPWELRHIENENSRYAAAFSNYRSRGRNISNLDEWRKALVSASGISGYALEQHQDNLCEKIVSRVLQEMEKRKLLPVAKYPVGLAELVQDFKNSCSKTQRDKVTMVGIFGLGGSGKTTLAKELFNRKSSGYHASCFLSDVRESDAKGELHCLQSQLLKDLFGEDRQFMTMDEGIGHLKHRLGSARHFHFLIVLDDVDSLQQLRHLLFEDMLSPGSLVIITTRGQSVLTGADISIRYKMKEMDRNHAKELFCSHAFRGRDPPISYEKLVESFVKFCGGLPLSLTVLGAHVYGRDEYYWELELEKVKKILPEDIMQRLKISLDGLDREEKQIFIDIACCFDKISQHNLKSKAISIWKASGWSAEHALQTLQDKCLVEVYFSEFIMHDHLRDLGRQMADELGPPRLWRQDVLRSMEAKGFEKILAETKGRCFHEFEDSSLKTKITYFIGSLYDSAETQLLYLDIVNPDPGFKNFPPWIPLRKLVCLTVGHMKELWSTFQQQLQSNTQASFELRKLKISFTDSSQNLPDLIGMFSRLEELEIVNSLKGTDITSFLQSLKQLSNLRSLILLLEDGSSFSGNLNLEDSTSSRMNSLETIDFFSLDNISKLLISRETCPRLQSLKVQMMRNLNEMQLKQLERLNTLEVSGCRKLETISGLSSLTGLQSLKVRYCSKLETISGLSSLTELQVFEAENCEGLKSLPTLAHLRGLERVTIVECHQLQNIEGLEEFQGLKSLHIDGYALVRNSVHGLKRLPSESTVLIRKAVDEASSRLDVNLFSDVIGAPSVVEIETGEYSSSNGMNMRSPLRAITIYALLVRPGYSSHMRFEGGYFQSLTHGFVRMITILLTPHSRNVRLCDISIEKGFMAIVNEGEEGKALTVLQTIVDRLYGESMVADDVGTD